MYEELIKRLKSESTLPYSAIKDMRDAADVIEKLTKKYLASEVDNTNLTGLLAEEHAKHMWILVTERLPKKPEGYPKCEIRRTYYLVALKSGCVETLGYEFDRDEWQVTGSPVVAWMPLPEPPKEET